jgi:hypothetical protein
VKTFATFRKKEERSDSAESKVPKRKLVRELGYLKISS